MDRHTCNYPGYNQEASGDPWLAHKTRIIFKVEINLNKLLNQMSGTLERNLETAQVKIMISKWKSNETNSLDKPGF